MTPQVVYSEIPGGLRGTEVTLRRMADLVHGAVWQTRQKALELVQGSKDTRDFVAVVRNFVRLHVTVVDEPDEILHSPVYMLGQIERLGRAYGDCDDVAMLVAALLNGLGVPARFRAVNRTDGGSFAHVFTEWYDPGTGWVAEDPTITHYPVYPPDDFLIQEL